MNKGLRLGIRPVSESSPSCSVLRHSIKSDMNYCRTTLILLSF